MKKNIQTLFQHLYWADERLYHALSAGESSIQEAVSEFAHVIGAEEVWLARLQQRTSSCPVWPELSGPELKELMEKTHQNYREYLENLEEKDLSIEISYTNSAGKKFTNITSDILFHVALHSQYHRGKINLLLREKGFEPAPTDYIAFIRGEPAATQKAEE